MTGSTTTKKKKKKKRARAIALGRARYSCRGAATQWSS
jgi:hypothetical protein